MQYSGSVQSRTRVLRELHREQATISNDHQRRKQTKIEHSESNEECNWKPDEANDARRWEHRKRMNTGALFDAQHGVQVPEVPSRHLIQTDANVSV